MDIFETSEVECPSGLKGLVRPLTVKDINSLATRRNGKDRKNVDRMARMLSGIWTETIDVGPYAGSTHVSIGQGISDWSRMLLGDRAFLIVEARRLTWGDDFFFGIGCRSCRNRIEWQIDLTELEHTGLSDEAREAIDKDGLDAILYRTLPKSGSKIGFRMLLGTHQRNVAAAMEKGEDEMQVAGLLSRLSYIEGTTSPGDRRKFVNNLHMVDVEYLKEQWEEADIFVQDQVEIECPRCAAISEVVLPTDERFFSARSAKPRKQSSNYDD